MTIFDFLDDYRSYKGNEKLIEDHFDVLFSDFHCNEQKRLDALRSYCNFVGYPLPTDAYYTCTFAEESLERDVDGYFGDEGVCFSFLTPVAPFDGSIILTYEEFYEVVERRYLNHVETHPENKDTIIELLACLKKKIFNREKKPLAENEERTVSKAREILKRKTEIRKAPFSEALQEENEACNRELLSVLSQDFECTLVALQSFDREETLCASEIFEKIVVLYGYDGITLVDCLRRLAAKYPDIDIAASVKAAEHAFHRFYKKQREKIMERLLAAIEEQRDGTYTIMYYNGNIVEAKLDACYKTDKGLERDDVDFEEYTVCEMRITKVIKDRGYYPSLKIGGIIEINYLDYPPEIRNPQGDVIYDREDIKVLF